MRGRSVKPSWKRDADRVLEAELRAARPRPRAEVTQAIADRVRSRDNAGKRRFGRLPLALGVGLSTLFLAPVVAAGFGGLGTNGKSAKLTSSERALYSKSGSGRALRSVSSATRKRASTSRRRAGRSQAVASIAPGGGGSAFMASIFEPQNHDDAVVAQYCRVGGVIIQSNTGTITQGGNAATGGNATSTGGNGGDASTGNTQSSNGTATGTGGITSGGNTSATSGAATGGAGGSATSTGGSATAGNVANQTLVNNVC